MRRIVYIAILLAMVYGVSAVIYAEHATGPQRAEWERAKSQVAHEWRRMWASLWPASTLSVSEIQSRQQEAADREMREAIQRGGGWPR